MARHRRVLPELVAEPPELPGISRAVRQSKGFSLVTVTLAAGLLGMVAYAPLGAFTEQNAAAAQASAAADIAFDAGVVDGQSLDVQAVEVAQEERAGFEAVIAPPVFVAPTATPDPGTAQAYALDQVLARGWGTEQFDCLVALWAKESGWRYNAHNASSGAYGIPQAMPGSKMASAGADWQTNPNTQVNWGLGYISGRYGTPCAAWEHSGIKGWY